MDTGWSWIVGGLERGMGRGGTGGVSRVGDVGDVGETMYLCLRCRSCQTARCVGHAVGDPWVLRFSAPLVDEPCLTTRQTAVLFSPVLGRAWSRGWGGDHYYLKISI